METIVVILFFIIAGWYLYRIFAKALKSEGSSCGCGGCGGCSSSNNAEETRLNCRETTVEDNTHTQGRESHGAS
jgi:hypothetical protein